MDQGSSSSRKRGRYDAAEIPTDVKEALAAVCVELVDRGVDQKLFLECANEAGYHVSRPTLIRWMRQVRGGEPVISPHKLTGGESALSAEEKKKYSLAGLFVESISTSLSMEGMLRP
jgi:hypothetical protein